MYGSPAIKSGYINIIVEIFIMMFTSFDKLCFEQFFLLFNNKKTLTILNIIQNGNNSSKESIANNK